MLQVQHRTRHEAILQRMADLEYIRPEEVHGPEGPGSALQFLGRGGFGSVYRGVWQVSVYRGVWWMSAA